MCSPSAPSAPQTPTTQNINQSALPAWAEPYSKELLGKAQALTDTNQNAYQSYGGERLAGFTPMQQQAFQNIAGMQVSPQTGQATGLAGMAGLGGLGAGQNYMNMATNPAAIQAFMSPYQQNVTDWQKQQAIMDYGRQLPGIGASAAQQGAFGGSRHGLVESEAQRNLQNTLAGIQATGSQNAFNAAQQAQQFGANLGLQGLQTAGQAAQTLGQLGQSQYGQQMGINTAMQQAGAQQQALEQQKLTNTYQDWLNRQNYPYQQLGFMSDILHGTPTGGITTSQTYQAAPSMFSQIAGLGLGLGALGKGFNLFKEGGEVKGYAEGGAIKGYASGNLVNPGIAAAYLTDHMDRVPSPQETMLANLADNPPAGVSPELLAAMKLNKIVTAQEKQQPAQNPTSTVVQDLKQQAQAQGLAGMPTNLDESFNAASGGIVAFANNGYVDPEYTADYRTARNFTEAAEDYGTDYGKSKSTFQKLREAIQPKSSWMNPNITAPSGEGIVSGLGKTARSVGRVAGKFVAPYYAYDLGTTAYDIANTPTDVIREYYGYTDEPSFLGDVAARSRAALGSLVPFSSTSEGIRALRQQRATGAQQSIPTQTVADTDDTEMGAAMQNKIRGVAPAPAPTQKPAVAARTAPTTTQEKPKTATEANDEVTNYFNKLLNSKSKYDPKKMGEDYKAILDEKMPSQAKDIREFYKAEGERLKGEGDKDRWLALAMGGFAIAAGKSPYAIQNFGEGLGLAAKEISAVNKEMRAAERERQKAERAELAADRAQEAGKFKEAKSMEMEGIKLREMEDQHRAQAANWLSSHKDRMAQIASQAQTAREQIQSHEKIAAMQQARAERQNALLNEYNARVLKGDAPGAKALLPSIEALATATGKGAGGERNDITASKTLLDSINKQAEFIAYHPTLKPDQKTKKLEELEQQRQQIQNRLNLLSGMGGASTGGGLDLSKWGQGYKVGD